MTDYSESRTKYFHCRHVILC